MASIRRTLSPVPRPGSLQNGEAAAIQTSSPLSRSSSNNQNHAPSGSSAAPLDYLLYAARSVFRTRFQASDNRPKSKGRIFRRGCFHFLMSFFVGIFLGLFVSLNLSDHSGLKQQQQQQDSFHFDGVFHSPVPANSSSSIDLWAGEFDGLIIVVTPTVARPQQGYYLNRLGHTLRLVPVPLLWIVVEMNSQSVDTAELLRNTGVTYRHLAAGGARNATGSTNPDAVLRNVAISHIRNHTLDGVVYFADDGNVYSVELFANIRKIGRIGAWTVARFVGGEGRVSIQGPICDGFRVTGWHLEEEEDGGRKRRFPAEMCGFAFNSTILWDPKRWRRPTAEAVRQAEDVGEDFQASRFLEQIVEDESQMECVSSGIMVWS